MYCPLCKTTVTENMGHSCTKTAQPAILQPFALDPHGGCAQREGELTAKVLSLELQIEVLMKDNARVGEEERIERERRVAAEDQVYDYKNVVDLALKDLREAQALGTRSNRIESAVRMLEEVLTTAGKRVEPCPKDVCAFCYRPTGGKPHEECEKKWADAAPKKSTRQAVEDAINESKGDKSKPWPNS